jgi:hypothetical protein
MKPAGYLLLIPVGLAGIAEAASGPAPTGLASPELKAHIREGLPAYQSPAANRAAREGDSPIFTDNHAAPDPDLLILPKLTVKERRDLPGDATRYLMGTRNYDRKMRNLYEDDLAQDGALEFFLNRYTIPLFSPSRAAKGRALALGQELDRLADLLSPEEAKGLNGMYDELALTLGRRAPKRR